MPKETKEKETSTSPDGQAQNNPESEPEPKASDPDPEPEPQPAGTEEFTDPMLRGRSPREIEALVQAQRKQVHEYGHRLSQMDERLKRIDERTTPPRKEPSARDYFDDPINTTRMLMEEQMAPLHEEMREAIRDLRGERVDDTMRQRHADWDSVKPYVDEMLTRMDGADSTDTGLLEHLYYTAKGYMSEKGITSSQPEPRREEHQPPPPPQHRSSSPPPPPTRERSSTPKRALTENEKVMARHYGMTPEEYLDWQQSEYEEQESNIDFVTRNPRDLTEGGA